MIEGQKIGSAVITFTINMTAEDVWDMFRRPLSEITDREILDLIRSHPAFVDDATVMIDREE